MMQVTMLTREVPDVREGRRTPDYPVVVEADGLTLLMTLKAAEQLAEKLELVIRGLRPDDEFEGPLPEFSPVRA